MRHSLIHYYREQFEEGNGCIGNTVLTYRNDIKRMLRDNRCNSLLDYGCGDATPYKDGKLEWPVERFALYDPAHPDYCERPTGIFDAVICCDVAEHVPEEEVPEFLDDVFSFAKKAVYMTVCCREAKRWIGEEINAHVCVKPMKWWHNRVSKRARKIHYQLIETK